MHIKCNIAKHKNVDQRHLYLVWGAMARSNFGSNETFSGYWGTGILLSTEKNFLRDFVWHKSHLMGGSVYVEYNLTSSPSQLQ